MENSKGFINLVWDSFQSNIPRTFQDVRSSQEFSDVTLACEDDGLVEAHRVILASGSSFFQKLLSSARLGRHPHPLLYLRGVSGQELECVLDFLYHGEARVSQGDLQAFLGLAQQLGVRGLMEERNGKLFEAEETAGKYLGNKTRAGTQYNTNNGRNREYLGWKERAGSSLKTEYKAGTQGTTGNREERNNEIIDIAGKHLEIKGRAETSVKIEEEHGNYIEIEDCTSLQYDVEKETADKDYIIEKEYIAETGNKDKINLTLPEKEEEDLIMGNALLDSEQENRLLIDKPIMKKKEYIFNHVYKLEGKTHCKHCGEKFIRKHSKNSSEKILTHVLDNHGERSDVQILKVQQQVRNDMIETVDNSFICKVCDFSSSSKPEMHTHINIHLEVYKRKKKKVSPVWNFAEKCNGFAKCKLCPKSIVTPGGSTTGIINHLKSCHLKEIESYNKTRENTSESSSLITLKPERKIKTNADSNKLSSAVWNFAERLNGFAKCKFCNKSMAIPSGSTTGIWTHVKSNHSEEIVKYNKELENGPDHQDRTQ